MSNARITADAAVLSTSADSYWRAVKLVLELETDPKIFRAHVAAAAPAGMANGTLTITAPEPYWPAGLAERARALLACMCGRRIELAIRRADITNARDTPARIPKSANGLARQFTFENFVSGSCNELALTSALHLATERGSTALISPLYIHGPVGLGKTHLAHAVGHRFLEKHPDCKVRLLSGEQFMREVQSHFMKDRIEKFRTSFRMLDLLILDDIQLIGRDSEQSQKQFVALFNFLYEQQRPIVLTSDRPAQNMRKEMPARMVSRLDQGVVVSMSAPGRETRVGILQRHAAHLRGTELPHEVALLLANHLRNNCRELIGGLRRLLAELAPRGGAPTVELARKIVGQYAATPAHVTPEQVLDITAKLHGLRRRDLQSKRRTKNVAHARHVSMYLCREHTQSSLPSIGELFNCHHSSVLHACRKISSAMCEDHELSAKINHLQHELLS